MVVALGDETGKILEQKSIPTTTPEETIPQIIDYFSQKNIAALGIGAFGPVDVVKGSPTYGRILNTPKIAWRQYDLVGALKEALHVPIGLDTDVNGSCLGEMTYGCAKGLDTVVYLQSLYLCISSGYAKSRTAAYSNLTSIIRTSGNCTGNACIVAISISNINTFAVMTAF